MKITVDNKYYFHSIIRKNIRKSCVFLVFNNNICKKKFLFYIMDIHLKLYLFHLKHFVSKLNMITFCELDVPIFYEKRDNTNM